MNTPLPNQEQKLRNRLALEAKRKKEETHFIWNPEVKLPKVFLHEPKA